MMRLHHLLMIRCDAFTTSFFTMRTTVTFDPDVKQRLESARGNRAFKEFVNDVLRRGLDTLEGEPERSSRPSLPLVHATPRLVQVDNIADVLELLDDAR
jgi:hypothetical protein